MGCAFDRLEVKNRLSKPSACKMLSALADPPSVWLISLETRGKSDTNPVQSKLVA